MLPFFTSAMVRGYAIYRPMPLLWAMLAAFVLHGLCEIAGLSVWRGLPDAVAAGIAFHFSVRWQLRKSFVAPLLAMLHVSTLWLGVGMGLYALQSLALLFDAHLGGLAPLHALGIGYCASMLVAMATRVTLGHSGRPLNADRWTWGLFWCFQLAPLARVAGEFVPGKGAGHAFLLAALVWLVVFGAWTRQHLAIYLKPRPDGQPG